MVISAQIESELIDLSPEEAAEFLEELGVSESGTGALTRATYHLLGLRTFLSSGVKEVRAWTIHVGDTARTTSSRTETCCCSSQCLILHPVIASRGHDLPEQMTR